MLVEFKVKNPILLSGDRHIGEISRIKYKGINITEITSSSLTRAWGNNNPEKNSYRIGNTVYDLNYGLIEIKGNTIEASIRSNNQEVKEKIMLNERG